MMEKIIDRQTAVSFCFLLGSVGVAKFLCLHQLPGKSVNLLSDLREYDSINNFITVQLQDLLKKDQAQFNNAYRNSHNDNGSVKLTCNPKNTSVDVAMKAQGCTPLNGLCGDLPACRRLRAGNAGMCCRTGVWSLSGLCLCPKTGYIIWHEFALNRVKFCVSVLIIHRVFEQ